LKTQIACTILFFIIALLLNSRLFGKEGSLSLSESSIKETSFIQNLNSKHLNSSTNLGIHHIVANRQKIKPDNANTIKLLTKPKIEYSSNFFNEESLKESRRDRNKRVAGGLISGLLIVGSITAFVEGHYIEGLIGIALSVWIINSFNK